MITPLFIVILTLGNSSGRIETAPIWSNQLEWAEGARTGRVVQAVGEVTLRVRPVQGFSVQTAKVSFKDFGRLGSKLLGVGMSFW